MIIINYIHKIYKRLTLKNIKCIVWDIDGTLYRNNDISQIIYDSYISYLASHLKISFNSAKKIMEKSFPILGNWGSVVSFYTKQSEKKILHTVEKQYNKSDFLSKDIELIQLFSYLRSKNIKNVFLTSSTRNQAESVLQRLGISNSVHEEIFAIEDVKQMKPHFSAFIKVMEYTNLDASQHLMVGDSLESDIIPAKKIGMKTCYVYPNTDSTSADFSLDTPLQIKNFI